MLPFLGKTFRRLTGAKPPAEAPRPKGPRFVSVREDGLCMRLNTILDAMLLARATGGSFAFTWDEAESHALDQQTTSSLPAVFVPRFIAAHRLSASGEAPVLTPLPSEEALAALMRAAGPAQTIQLDQPRSLTTFAPALDLPAGAYSEAFAAMDFAPAVRQAIAAARALPLPPKSVAIHLRGGDILHGTHAHHATYLHKAPSVLEIDALVARLAAEGQSVWLIGQEPDVQACMARRHPGVHLPVDHAPSAAGEVAQVLFDAVLMSRMQAIHGGNSGVTLLSRRLGDVPFHDLAREPVLAPDQSWRDDPLAGPAFDGVSAAMKAHAYVKVITATDPSHWTDLHLDLARLARRWRPDSKFLALTEICLRVALGQPEAAERLARTLLAEPMSPGLLPQMGYAFLSEGVHYFPLALTAPLARTDLAGRPALTLLAALRAASAGPDQRAGAEAQRGAALSELGEGAVDPVFRQVIDRYWRQTAGV